MQRKKHMEEQTIGIFRKAESANPVSEVCREQSVSEDSFCLLCQRPMTSKVRTDHLQVKKVDVEQHKFSQSSSALYQFQEINKKEINK